jgi:lysozyme
MRLRQLYEDGRIVKGVNTTVDVDTNSISREAGKFGNKVDKDGRPPTLSSKVKGKSTNVLFNLGLTESVENVKDMIKSHEGLRLKPYKDSVGKWTIGYGHLITKGEKFGKISKQEADELFDKDFEHHAKLAARTPGWKQANEKQRAAMIDLAFNMGPSWHRKFPAFSKAARKGDWNTAAKELVNSKWYKQVKSRARKIVSMIDESTLHENVVFKALRKLIKDSNSFEEARDAIYSVLRKSKKYKKYDDTKIQQMSHAIAKDEWPKRDLPSKDELDILKQIDKERKAKDFEIGEPDKQGLVYDPIKKMMVDPSELGEKWSAKYKRSINCNNPKGFSQKAHCAGRKKK